MKWNDYVVRNVGEMLLLVNICNNEVFEIDEFVKECVLSCQNNNGSLDFIEVSKKLGISPEEIKEEWKEVKNAILCEE